MLSTQLVYCNPVSHALKSVLGHSAIDGWHPQVFAQITRNGDVQNLTYASS